MNYYREYVEFLRKIRKEAGLTLEDVAENTGLAPATISKFERGVNNNANLLLYYMITFMNAYDLAPSLEALAKGNL